MRPARAYTYRVTDIDGLWGDIRVSSRFGWFARLRAERFARLEVFPNGSLQEPFELTLVEVTDGNSQENP
jgi:hypothetical protein